MTAVQTPKERVVELLKLRDSIDAEIARLSYGLRPTHKRPRNVVPDCGSETAYQRHKYYGEECPDGDACKKAHALHERLASVTRRSKKVA